MANRKTSEIIYNLNSAFAAETRAGNLTKEISLCPNPIVVDWNGVLASDNGLLELNPEAKASLEYMIAHGLTPFIITLADNWADMVDLLAHIITDVTGKVVVMTKETWSYIDPNAPWQKHVRGLFPGKNLIPIIDDDKAATTKNPGMIGFHVKTYKPVSNLLDRDINYEYQTLMAATKAATAPHLR